MFLTKLALKNLVRHRNRTLVTASIIAVAVFIFIVFDSLLGGMTQMSYNNIVDYESGHLQVVKQEYWAEKDKLPLENLLSTDQELLAEVKNLAGYQASSPEVNFQARLNTGTRQLPVVGKGIIPQRFNRVFELEDQFVAGSMFTAGEREAVMGKRLAQQLNLELGDYITLLVKDANETFNTISAEISGLVSTANPQVNRNFVYLPLNYVQQSLAIGDQVSKLIVTLDDRDQAAEAADSLKSRLKQPPNLTVIAWDQLEAVSIAASKHAANKVILLIILLIAAIAIINTVILAALERMNEIGMMKALGLRNKEIVYTFVVESTGIGIVGGSVGIILGALGVWGLSSYGLDFAGLYGVDMGTFGIPVIGKFYGTWNLTTFLQVFGFAVIVSLLSSILPAYWAADKDQVEAIEHR